MGVPGGVRRFGFRVVSSNSGRPRQPRPATCNLGNYRKWISGCLQKYQLRHFFTQLNEKFDMNQIRKFKPSKTWLVLGIALVIGGIAAFAASIFLKKQVADIEARNKGGTTNVLVAKIDIGKGGQLSPENIAIRAVPVEFSHSIAITPEEFDRVKGQALAYPVKRGEMILWGLMETQKVPTFSARVEAGHRAMTVPVDEVNSISGMLEPGDAIDLFATIDQKGKKTTFPLLQGVFVMATGQRSVDDPKTGEVRQFSTVTLNTTPDQANNIIVARELGKLTALLRNPDDKQRLSTTRYDIAALLGLKDVKTGTGTTAATVPVLYGNNLATMTPEGMQLVQRSTPTAAQTVAADLSPVKVPPGRALGAPQAMAPQP